MLARVALDTPVLPPLELLLEPARELFILIICFCNLALATELGQDVGPVWKSTMCWVHPIIFTKSLLGDDAAVLAPSSDEEPA